METDFITMLAERLDDAFGFSTAHTDTSPQSTDHTATVTGAEVWRDLIRRLLQAPIHPRALAEDYPGLDIPAILDGFAATEFTADGRISGSLLTHIPTDHSIEILPAADSSLRGSAWTWCYFDALLLACILRQPTIITSTCAHTGRSHTLSLVPSDTSDVPSIAQAPEHLTVSLPSSFTPGASLREDFCCRSRGWLHSSLHTCAQPGCTDTPAGVRYFPLSDALDLTAVVARKLTLLPSSATAASTSTTTAA